MRRILVLVLVLSAAAGIQRLSIHPALAVVRFCDVGQGDAAVIESGSYQMVIDGGPDNRVLECLARALPPGDHRVEAIMLSHPNTDHYRGLRDIIDRYQVGSFLMSGFESPVREYHSLLDDVHAHGIPVRLLKEGDTLALPSGSVSLLYPADIGRIKKDNDASLYARVTIGQTTLLFTGDAEKPAEQTALASGEPLRADILKVAHHGSRTSSTDEFISAIQPKVSVISVGAKNRYGHPTAQTLATLKRHASRVYRTDQNGTVTARIFKEGYRVSAER